MGCPDNGVANVSAGSFGAPLFVSFPHFLYANKSWTKHLKGLHPNPEKHGFYFDLEPTLAIPMRADAKIQINVLVEQNNMIDALNSSKFKFDKLLMPQLWTGIEVEIDDNMTSKLKLVLKVIPIVCYVVSSLLLLSGVLLILSVVYYKYFSKSHEKY